jgi:drug/metabolite transporter (DMT)-like permease
MSAPVVTETDAHPATTPPFRFGPELALAGVVLLWSSTSIVTKSSYAEISPLAFVFARFAVTTALAFAVLAVRQRASSWRVARADWGRFVLAGLTGYTLYQIGFALGLERTSPFSYTLLIGMAPLLTLVILAVIGEPTPLRVWAGVGVSLTGMAIFLFDKRVTEAGALAGDLFSFGAAASFAVYGIINRPLVQRYPVETWTAWGVLAGAVPLFLISLPAALAQPWQTVSLQSGLSLLYLAVFPVYIAYILWNWAVARRGIAAASAFTLLVPIVSGIFSAVIFGEAFGPTKLLGAALVLAGLVIVRIRRTEDSS